MRETFDIKHFNYGIISSLDEEDIHPESASDSTNVDGDSAEGVLMGIPQDITYLTNGNTALTDVHSGQLIEDNGVYYLIYFDKNASAIKAVKNFQSSTVANRRVDTLVSSVTEATFVGNNKEVHIGVGNGTAAADAPRWIGKVLTGQFKHTDYTDFFKGTGTDDLVSTLTGYTGISMSTFDVVITDGTSNPNTFKWRKDGGAYSSPTAITAGVSQALSDGVTIVFADATGHVLDDAWHITTDGLYVSYAEPLTSTALSIAAVDTAGTGEKSFLMANTYQWMISLIYDGYQEGELYSVVEDSPDADSEYYTITITAADMNINPASFNRRITGINLYRAEFTDAATAKNRGLFRLVASADINDSGWTAASDDMTLVIVDYGVTAKVGSGSILNYGAVTYTENSGMGEDNGARSITYGLATEGNGYQFVGDCYHGLLPDAERYIFRSKSLRYDMFDWTQDFVVMPEKITAMKFYEGKLYAFSLNKVFRINPDGLYIEDVFEGAGAQSQRSVHTNEYGMFFANSLNAWMYNGQILPIGDAIRLPAGTGKSWQSLTYASLANLIVTSDDKKGYVLFINQYTDTNPYLCAWAYSPTKQRWDFWDFRYVPSANSGVVKGKDGEVYLSNATGTYQLMRHATFKRAWDWTSQELSFGQTRQKKSFALIKADVTGSVTITYGVDGAVATTAYTNENLLNVYNKTLKVKLSAAAATSVTNYVDSLEIVFRRLKGAR